MPYFFIECGLRGLYCDGNGFVVKCGTRRELKATLQREANDFRDAGGIGLSNRNVTRLASLAWKDRKKLGQLPYCLPFRWKYQDSWPYGIMVSSFTRSEYLQFTKESV